MNGSRALILARIAEANAEAAEAGAFNDLGNADNPGTVHYPGDANHPGAVGSGGPDVNRQYRRANDQWETNATAEELTNLLANRLADYGARLWPATLASVGQAVAQALGDAAAVVTPLGLPHSWMAPWRESTPTGQVLADQPGHLLTPTELDQADAVVTEADLAIALTGTLALQGGPSQGRRALSLVPDHHVCVLHQGDIVHGVPAAIVRLDHTRPITLISGPSATADIEMERVQGVHGPRQLDIVLVTPDP